MSRKDGPTMAWDPVTGESQIFATSAEVPEGFLDHHPHSQDKREVPVKPNNGALPMTKAEIVAALRAGGIETKPNVSAKAAYDLLMTSLKDALTDAKVEFPADADAPALLKLVPTTE